jgi:SAM-dependent methyltransferase
VTQPPTEAHEFWEQFYGEREQVWSGQPNAALVDEVAGLPPGTALDLGCGEGADAIWLASQGWRVTAADISQAALDRGARHAADAGVAERITWERHDFAHSLPAGRFDLVSVQFLHSPVADPRDAVLPAAAAAVAAGGTLLVVSHEAVPWGEHDWTFPSPQEVLASLAIDADEWIVEHIGSRTRLAHHPEGGDAEVVDSVVRLRRR